MTAKPLIEEASGGHNGSMIAGIAGIPESTADAAELELICNERPLRRLAVYPASAGFDLVEELDHLWPRTVEPNVFFNPRFLAPAMPRLEDREVRFAVIRDGDEYRNRLRLLVPFSIERPAIPLAVPVMRTWSSPFGPLGTPLLDRDDPAGVIADFFEMLARPHLKLPKVLVLPDMRLDGAVSRMLSAAADTSGLPLAITARFERTFLESDSEGEEYLKASLGNRRYREFRRLGRRLAEQGTVAHKVARNQDDVRHALEQFLTLEASGWKGRKRTAMVIDRHHAAFAREAVHRMTERDMCRIHSLTLDGRAIASLVVFIEAGIAYTWKIAYDETLSAFSPGVLLMMEVTGQHLDDPNIIMTDSCAVPDHPMIGRLWSERKPMGTVIIGLTPDADRATRQAASQLHLHRKTRKLAAKLRDKMRGLLRRN